MNKLLAKIISLVSRGKVTRVNDSEDVQKIQLSILSKELKDDVERIQDYGLTSSPPINSETVNFSIGGNRDHTLILKVGDRKYRLKGLQEGEVALYSMYGDKIHLKKDNKIEIQTKDLEINLEKIKISNQQAEIIDLQIQLLDELIKTQTLTAGGPMNFMPSHLQKYTEIKNKMNSFKA